MNVTLAQKSAQLRDSQHLDFESLKPTEKRVLSAMLVAKTDKEAYTLAGISEQHFYNLKKKLKPYMAGLKNNLTSHAWDQLLGYVNKAVNVLGSQLGHNDARVAQSSAKDILNRVLGEPTKRVESKSDDKITILGITATAKQLENLKNPIISGESEPLSDDLKPENKKDDPQVIEI